MNYFPTGSIGFSGPRTGGSFLQKCIKFFTQSKWSHSFVVTFPVEGETMVMEAVSAVSTVPLSRYRTDENMVYEIYRVSAPDAHIHYALMKCYHEYAGVHYGFLQLPCFVVKWLYEKLRIPMVHLPDWVRDGIICSELVDDYLGSASPYAQALLKEFDIDLVSPEDIYRVVVAHPELFTLVEMQ